MYLTSCGQDIVDRAINVKCTKAEVIWVFTDIEAVPFNRGFYSVDLKYFFKVTLAVFTGVGRPTEVEGLATFDKKVILFGSEGNAKVFESKYKEDAFDPQLWRKTNMPHAVVEVADCKMAGKNTKDITVKQCVYTVEKSTMEPWNCYIASGSSQQSATTFKKLEDIANDRIASLINSSGYIFKNEVEVPNASGDGFSHNPSGFTYSLHNGSFSRTLSSNIDRNRGARASCVIFDESAFLSQDLLSVYKAFCATKNEFATGFDKDGNMIDQTRLLAIPKPIPNN